MVKLTPVDNKGNPLREDGSPERTYGRNAKEYISREREQLGYAERLPNAQVTVVNRNGEIAVLKRAQRRDDALSKLEIPSLGGKGETGDINYDFVTGDPRPVESRKEWYERIVQREANEEGSLTIPSEDLELIYKGHAKVGQRDFYVMHFGLYHNPEVHGSLKLRDRREGEKLEFRQLSDDEIKAMYIPLGQYGKHVAKKVIKFRKKCMKRQKKISGNGRIKDIAEDQQDIFKKTA